MIIQLKATDGSIVEFEDSKIIGKGEMKEVYFSPDKSYVVAFYKEKDELVKAQLTERLESTGGSAGAYYQQTDGIRMKRNYREDKNHVPGDGSYYDRHPEAGRNGSYNNGYNNGYQNGYSNGYSNGYQNGNQQRFYYGNTNRYYGDGSFYDYNVRGGAGVLSDSDYLELAIKTKKSSYCDKISDSTLRANCIDSVMRIGGW